MIKLSTHTYNNIRINSLVINIILIYLTSSITAYFINWKNAIIVLFSSVMFELLSRNEFSKLIIIPVIATLIFIILIMQNLKRQFLFVTITISYLLIIFIFWEVYILYYHGYYNKKVITEIIVESSFYLTFIIIWASLVIIDKVFLNLEEIYENSFYTPEGFFRPALVNEVIHRFINENHIRFAYLIVINKVNKSNIHLQYNISKDEHEDINHELSKYISNLFKKKQLIKFKIDQDNYGLFFNIDNLDDWRNNLNNNFLSTNKTQNPLTILDRNLKKFAKSIPDINLKIGASIYGLNSYSVEELISYSKFAIYWGQNNNFNDHLQLFNRKYFDIWHQEKSKIKNIKTIINLDMSNSTINEVIVGKEVLGIAKYEIFYNHLFRKNYHKKSLDLEMTIKINRYFSFKTLKKIADWKTTKINRILLPYNAERFYEKDFNLIILINNLLKICPHINKGLIFNIDDSFNRKNEKLNKIFQYFQAKNIAIIFKLKTKVQISNLLNFYNPNFLIIEDKQFLKIKKIIARKQNKPKLILLNK